ncbi:MAG: biotin--[acetyl-CoA-carboxylase] ligase, partial [Xanthobacteraceae bacterium]
LADWLVAARGIGEEITVRTGNAEKHGRCAGLDRSGRLILELRGGGTEKISAGDVFPLLSGGQPVPSRAG